MPQSNTSRLPNQEAIRHFDNKGLMPSFDYREVAATEHAVAFTVAKMLDGDMLADVHQAISQSLKNGTGFADFKKQMKPYLMAKGWWGEQLMGDPWTGELKKVQLGSTRRLRTIYHTNLQTAYAAGQWQRIQDTKKALPYLQYMPSLSEHPRLNHRRYYGIVRPVDDPIWQQIYPPNGYGCQCWVKQLTRSQAITAGISEAKPLEMEEVVNKRTGEIEKVPKDIMPSFAHNHDRLTAMQKLYNEKLAGWTHIPEAQKNAYKTAFERGLNQYMLDLVTQADFNSMVPTVVGQDFARRFAELQAEVKKRGGNRTNSMELRKLLAKGDEWVVATLSPDIQQQLAVETVLIKLSDDTIVKMLAHHPESEVELFRQASFLLKNATKPKIENEQFVIYYIVGNVRYKATVKATKDKKELYLTTIFKIDSKG